MSSAASRPPISASQSLQQTAAEPASVASAPSSAEARSAQSSPQASASSSQPTPDPSGLRPPKRPQLMGPPARPKPPTSTPERTPQAAPEPPEPETPKLIGPISTPSERLQYRAIGLLKGKYVASEEQLNRGNICLEDDTLIDAVLLGRVTSLIKKHIDLEANHLWVVYPRTLYKEEDNEPSLHMQIVGVWEPETLNADSADSNESEPRYLSTVEATEQRDQFSVRGEIAKYNEETGEVVVNIVQKSKSENVKPKRPFKLLISGKLEGRTTGYFWDLRVKREGGQLVLEEATQIAVVPPKKKSKDAHPGGGRKRPGGKPRSGSSAPKPMPKKKKAEDSSVGSEAKDTTDVESTNAKPKVAKPVENQSADVKSADLKSPKTQKTEVQEAPVEIVSTENATESKSEQ